MAKKVFDVIPTADIYANQIAIATAKPESPAQPKPVRMRHNLLIPEDISAFIKTMAAVKGMSVTAYVCNVLRKSMQDQQEEYRQAKEFLDMYRND